MKYYSSGKILLTAEYLVLKSAKAIALPTVFGQSLKVEKHNKSFFLWTSYDNDNHIWFYANFDFQLKDIIDTNNKQQAQLLLQLLLKIKQYKSNLFVNALQFTTKLDFNKEWGLGSSSTFINNLAQWSGINPFDLLQDSFGGSGYDIAVAIENKAVEYQLINNKPKWKIIEFNPNFKNDLFFIYLNKKQNSRNEIAHFNKLQIMKEDIAKISNISKKILTTNQINEFAKLIDLHEEILATILNKKTIKNELFPDFEGSIKSLGAWGGDFILAFGNNTQKYFNSKGYHTIINYTDFIL